jgi:hypothetical protein
MGAVVGQLSRTLVVEFRAERRFQQCRADLLPGDDGVQGTGSVSTHLGHGRGHRGERDGQPPRERDVVVPDHGEVLPHDSSVLAGGAHRADRGEVVDREDRRDLRMAFE